MSTAGFPDSTVRESCGWRALGTSMAWFRRHGIRVRPVLTDNGAGYVSDRFARLCRSTGMRHLRTRPYTPRTNGKAERFIQTLFARMGLPPRLSPFAPPN